MKYIILKYEHPHGLQDEVNRYLDKGWILQGGVSCALAYTPHSSSEKTIFAQALTFADPSGPLKK